MDEEIGVKRGSEWKKAIPQRRDRFQSRWLVRVVGTLLVAIEALWFLRSGRWGLPRLCCFVADKRDVWSRGVLAAGGDGKGSELWSFDLPDLSEHDAQQAAWTADGSASIGLAFCGDVCGNEDRAAKEGRGGGGRASEGTAILSGSVRTWAQQDWLQDASS